VSDERQLLTKEEAIAKLPDKEYIHTFRQANNPFATALIGAGWDKNEIISAMDNYEFELSGERATSMNHGMAFQDEHGWCFVETKEA
jgi:hypothetical protein